MKFDKNDINSQLGLLAVGIILLTLGIYSRGSETITSYTIFNVIEIICIGMGVVLIVYSLLNVIRITKNQK